MGQVAKFNAHPGLIHWNAVLKTFSYLKYMGSMGIIYRSSVDFVDTQVMMFKSENDQSNMGRPILSGYSDANYAVTLIPEGLRLGLFLC